jgi:periplasmic protein CpxP/Spy
MLRATTVPAGRTLRQAMCETILMRGAWHDGDPYPAEEGLIVIRWRVALLLLALTGAPTAVLAQATDPANSPANPTTPPAANPAAAEASSPANYAATPPGKKKPKISPEDRAAQRQSGLSEAQAKNLLQEKGYSQVIGVQAAPNSVWVWQADVMKNGRPMRIGIDYRGNVLDLSGGRSQPCTSPGVRLGVGGSLGVGSRLSQADSCSGR